MKTILSSAPFQISRVKSGYSDILVCIFKKASFLSYLLTDAYQLDFFLKESIKPYLGPSLNKIAFISENEMLDADLDFFFIQYVPAKDEFEMTGNCGNALIGGSIAEICLNQKPLDQTYKIKNLNSNKYTKIRVKDLREEQVTAEIIFENPEGSLTNTLLPTGKSIQTIQVNGKSIDISIVDAANPYVYVNRKQLSLTERQFFSQTLEISTEMRQIRKEAQSLIGIHADSVFPKFAIISASSHHNQISARMVTVPHWHKSFALTGMVNLVVSSQINGTITRKNIQFTRGNHLKILCADRNIYTTTFYKDDHFKVSIVQNVNLKGVLA
ncbi:PrpF domain-containing protein [Bacillus gobiensis]|uniref:PrpF domain-containing protein n=1 Tax=Bacillus gobiensis TaxID=1441095 RepID=UPI003D1A1EDB